MEMPYGLLSTNSCKASCKMSAKRRDKSGEKDIKLVKTAENPAIALKSSKEPFNFVSATIGNTIQLPKGSSGLDWAGTDRRVAQLSPRQS